LFIYFGVSYVPGISLSVRSALAGTPNTAAFLNRIVPARSNMTHISLPNFVGMLPGANEVTTNAMPNFVRLDTGSLALALAPGIVNEEVGYISLREKKVCQDAFQYTYHI
jgi:hypothetical protein